MPFYIHRDLICNESSVFKAAFSGEFKEASNQSIDLKDQDVEAVERMVQWLYSGQYELVKWSSEDDENTASTRYWQLAKLNTLADKYNIIGLSNTIIDQLYILHSKNFVPQLEIAAYVYDNTTENSAFRKLFIAWYAWEIDMKWYQNDSARKSLLEIPEMAVDIAIAFGIKASDPAKKTPFRYDKSKYYHQSKECPNVESK